MEKLLQLREFIDDVTAGYIFFFFLFSVNRSMMNLIDETIIWLSIPIISSSSSQSNSLYWPRSYRNIGKAISCPRVHDKSHGYNMKEIMRGKSIETKIPCSRWVVEIQFQIQKFEENIKKASIYTLIHDD